MKQENQIIVCISSSWRELEAGNEEHWHTEGQLTGMSDSRGSCLWSRNATHDMAQSTGSIHDS